MHNDDRAPVKRRPVSTQKRTIGLLLFASLVLAAGFFPAQALQVERPRDGRVLWISAVEPGDRFFLMYRHSVELCRVWDHFRIDGDYRIILFETVFGSSNTGLPSVLGPGERFTRGKTSSRISGMQRVLPAIEIWVKGSYENTLGFGNGQILLSQLAGDALLRLRIRKVTCFELAFHETFLFFNHMSEEMR